MTTEGTGAALGDGYDDLTPYLIDLARTMEQATAPTVAPVPVPENSGTHPTGEPGGPDPRSPILRDSPVPKHGALPGALHPDHHRIGGPADDRRVPFPSGGARHLGGGLTGSLRDNPPEAERHPPRAHLR